MFQDLGLLGYQASDGIVINDSDQLAVDGIGPGSTALFYASGHAHRIGSIDGGYTSVLGMNNHGDIVGSGNNGDGGIVGFSWVNGVFNDLSGLGIVRARAINDADVIVGSSGYYWVYGGYGHSSLHAFRYTGSAFTDLGCFTGDPRTDTEAFGINAAGDIVGYSTAADGTHHAFLFHAGTMQDLGTLGSDVGPVHTSAIAINNNGLILGNATNPYGADLGAFLYTNGAMADLQSLVVNGGDGWSQLVASGLNDAGEIVGTGTVDGGTRGFLLVPTQTAGAGPGPLVATSVLLAPRPNPFRASAEITFDLSARGGSGTTRLEIYDVSGRRVVTLFDDRLAPGPHSVAWNGRGDGGSAAPAGLYFARLTTRDGSTSRRLVLAK